MLADCDRVQHALNVKDYNGRIGRGVAGSVRLNTELPMPETTKAFPESSGTKQKATCLRDR